MWLLPSYQSSGIVENTLVMDQAYLYHHKVLEKVFFGQAVHHLRPISSLFLHVLTLQQEFRLCMLQVKCFVLCPYMDVQFCFASDFTSKATESPVLVIVFLSLFVAPGLLN